MNIRTTVGQRWWLTYPHHVGVVEQTYLHSAEWTLVPPRLSLGGWERYWLHAPRRHGGWVELRSTRAVLLDEGEQPRCAWPRC